MPFQSENQRKKCWRMYHQDLKRGVKPKWNCSEWEKYTSNNKYPTNNKHVDGRVVRIGPRGGKYIIKDGKKKYLK